MSNAAAEPVAAKSAAPQPIGERQGDSPPHRRFQVSLRDLFLLVTYFNLASWLAVLWNPGVMIPAIGLFLTWLSYRGYLWRLQSAGARPKLFAGAWVLFLGSMAMPTLLVGCSNGPTPTVQYGWEVAGSGLILLAKGVEDVDIRNLPQSLGHLLYAIFVNLPNALMILSPLFYYRQLKNKGREMVTLWGCGAAATWFWAILGVGQFRIGYYVWSLAISLEFLRRHVTRRAFVVTALFLPVMYLVLLLFD